MNLKSLVKALSQSNGGDKERALEILEQRRKDIERFNYEIAFKKDFRRVNKNENY